MDNYQDLKSTQQEIPKISVIGVGGAGCNAVTKMIKNSLGVNLIVADTDTKALSNNKEQYRIQLGSNLTKGFGSSGSLDIGRESAIESKDDILLYLSDSKFIFIVAGMGGGTGTGAAPIIAKYLRENIISKSGVQHELSSLIVGVITKPFDFEGEIIQIAYQKGLDEIKKYVDIVIVIPNQSLFRIADDKTTFRKSFALSDEVLGKSIHCISGLITDAGLINLDYADLISLFYKKGKATIGIGYGVGDDRAVIAILNAMSDPILDKILFKKAKSILVSIIGGDDLTLFEIDTVLNRMRDEIANDTNIIFGSVYDESKTGSISVRVVATEIEDEAQ